MRHASTRMLPLAAVWLLCGLTAQAQIDSPLSAGRMQKPVPALLPQVTVPKGAVPLRQPLPALGGMSAKQLAQQRALLGTSLKPADLAHAVRAQGVASGPVSEQWVARYNAPETSFDVATSTAVDPAGNVYVTGYSFEEYTSLEASPGDYNYVTVKYSPSGQQQWVASFNGPGSQDDIATDIAVDASGNVYVTGYSVENFGTYDYTTIKYSAAGQQLWTARYNGPANRDDLATSLAVDAAGNVYVTGTSYNGPTTSYDYATVKYSESGTQLWATRYTGSGTSDEVPTTLGVDGAGDVYVTGTAYNGNQSNYTTLKYAGSSGAQVWEAAYNGPANSYDLVRDLAVDAAGNVAITGTSDSGTSYDYATVRYTSSGQQLWTARYNGNGNSYDEATAVVVDNVGNVTVTGYADTGNGDWNYMTIQYIGTTGQTRWGNSYAGPDRSYDEATDLAVDANRNVYVTGRSYQGSQCDYVTVRYIEQFVGRSTWVSRYSGPANGDDEPTSIAVTGNGGVAVTGTSFAGPNNFDYATLQYDQSSGEQLWATRYEGTRLGGIPSQATDMAVDPAGNVAVTGRSRNVRGILVYATVKYTASGQKLWEARLPIALTLESNPVVDMDAAGNVYMAGTNNNEYYTIKYDGASGKVIWSRRYFGSTLNRGNEVKDLVVDAVGNAYVTGASVMGLSTRYDYTTIKYSPSGEQLWRRQYFGQGVSSNEVPSRITLDAAGNVYVTGTSSAPPPNDFIMVTIKYSAGGEELWEARYNDPVRQENPTDIAVDATGNVYVTGTNTLKYSPGGQLLWTAQYFADGAAIAADAAGNVLVTGTGFLNGSSNQRVWVTAKCDGATGQQLWQVINGAGNSTDQAVDLATDGAGNAYVTGISVAGSINYNTIKYAGASGQVLWETRDNSPSITNNRPVGIVVDATGNVYVGGTAFTTSSDPDYLIIKYNQLSAPAAILTTRPALAATSAAVQDLLVYPNPAADQASVSFRPVQNGAAQVLVYNQLGQQVASLYEGTVRKGQRYELPLNSQKLTAGLYTCVLRVNNKRETVKLLVTR
ncbi:SBBP repeat-containing protein [Hymenobacter tibetensis]|uniref:SBBP repeat-containing protein n=1 Tax=Hymenobacter tibetensis TaxID=497967 RepID=A0ABY4CSK7_9BACT|nr:SBBP repeat-containing protein [Hymenobacter tibetensis]UOG73183.1 SBBP repeat-containing protein [Hymenobacter tibetensis]